MAELNITPRCVIVQGNFDVLHPGHIRLLSFARACGDKLIVAVNTDAAMAVKSRINETHRLEMVNSLECVDEAFLTSKSPQDTIEEYKPYAVVKGKEFESRDNPELAALNQYGGKLIFGSGEYETIAEQYIRKANKLGSNFDFSEASAFAQRHDITQEKLNHVMDRLNELKVLVIGEIIVDEYVQGTAVGMSQEDPTIVMTPNKTEKFLGGAAITAGHIKSLGARSVSLFSVVGNDAAGQYAKDKIGQYNVHAELFTDTTRPTPLKTRYRASNKTLLRVNQVRQHKIAKELQTSLLKKLEKAIPDIDLLVFSDFNYGVLPQPLVEAIITLCKEHHVKVVADSQTSSQVGDISRYHDMDLITPTERETRVALNNPDDGLVILAHKLSNRSNPKNLVITLGEEGIFIHIPNRQTNDWENDRLPALNRNATDPAGAGDCFLAASSLALCVESSPWEAFYLGSLAAACQVDSLGNTPLSLTVLKQAISESFK
ncbi:adenylyltransferase/cytidyltransferase family protein [Pseudoalteromonas luteoviolacea]|uniref:PfkB family carbohydrate kinase n=1 Tax=Pseudoalteromonas luteoviolacea TaxID=43657 RepID=UPI001B38FB8E|nr:PfkB family carbohydrate kinase [Pseudoalteromonas luteoviolacea]MBQ4810474.1 adenylyltransferase/cytidyltransferase family protein [Pseudoalteromonas luteoviolacea]